MMANLCGSISRIIFGPISGWLGRPTRRWRFLWRCGQVYHTESISRTIIELIKPHAYLFGDMCTLRLALSEALVNLVYRIDKRLDYHVNVSVLTRGYLFRFTSVFISKISETIYNCWDEKFKISAFENCRFWKHTFWTFFQASQRFFFNSGWFQDGIIFV